MIRIIKVSDIDKFAAEIVPKPIQKNKIITEKILKDVQKNGDTAVRKYEKKFNKAKILSFKLTPNEIEKSFSNVSQSQIKAIRAAKKRLELTENSIKSLLKTRTIHNAGIKISKEFVPIQSTGCYIPGGLARYPSTVIMSVVPAKIAGVKRIVVVSPPNSSGNIDPLTVVTAQICGADEIYRTGGVQSIAALAYGTKSIQKVDKIVGPGGAFVTAAKSIVSENTSIDMLAGPTELGIVADSSANPKFIALDLISQAEHSADTFCYLITNSEKLANSVNEIISELISSIQRENLVQPSLMKNSFIAICKTRSEMIKLANNLAPEHLQIMTKNAESISSKINSPGLVLVGDYSPSSASDYMFGSNHILPTNGFGKTRGSLSVLDFIKINTKVTSSKKSLSEISKNLKTLTDAEGLPNHYGAVEGRLK